MSRPRKFGWSPTGSFATVTEFNRVNEDTNEVDTDSSRNGVRISVFDPESNVLIDRARKGLGLDLAHNIRVLREELKQAMSKLGPLSSQVLGIQQLLVMYEWLERVSSTLNLNDIDQQFVFQQLICAPDESQEVSCGNLTAFVSPMRNLALKLCGWTEVASNDSRQPILLPSDSRVETMNDVLPFIPIPIVRSCCESGDIERAAGLALFHGYPELTVQLLQIYSSTLRRQVLSSANPIDPNIMSVYSHAELLQLIAMAISGYPGPVFQDSQDYSLAMSKLAKNVPTSSPNLSSQDEMSRVSSPTSRLEPPKTPSSAQQSSYIPSVPVSNNPSGRSLWLASCRGLISRIDRGAHPYLRVMLVVLLELADPALLPSPIEVEIASINANTPSHRSSGNSNVPTNLASSRRLIMKRMSSVLFAAPSTIDGDSISTVYDRRGNRSDSNSTEDNRSSSVLSPPVSANKRTGRTEDGLGMFLFQSPGIPISGGINRSNVVSPEPNSFNALPMYKSPEYQVDHLPDTSSPDFNGTTTSKEYFRISLADRIAFSCRFLDDGALPSYLLQVLQHCSEIGRPEALILSGISGNSAPIVQRYLDSTGDIFTAAIVGSYMYRSVQVMLVRAVVVAAVAVNFYQLNSQHGENENDKSISDVINSSVLERRLYYESSRNHLGSVSTPASTSKDEISISNDRKRLDYCPPLALNRLLSAVSHGSRDLFRFTIFSKDLHKLIPGDNLNEVERNRNKSAPVVKLPESSSVSEMLLGFLSVQEKRGVLACMRWIMELRSFLNRAELWQQRARFDVAKGILWGCRFIPSGSTAASSTSSTSTSNAPSSSTSGQVLGVNNSLSADLDSFRTSLSLLVHMGCMSSLCASRIDSIRRGRLDKVKKDKSKGKKSPDIDKSKDNIQNIKINQMTLSKCILVSSFPSSSREFLLSPSESSPDLREANSPKKEPNSSSSLILSSILDISNLSSYLSHLHMLMDGTPDFENSFDSGLLEEAAHLALSTIYETLCVGKPPSPNSFLFCAYGFEDSCDLFVNDVIVTKPNILQNEPKINFVPLERDNDLEKLTCVPVNLVDFHEDTADVHLQLEITGLRSSIAQFQKECGIFSKSNFYPQLSMIDPFYFSTNSKSGVISLLSEFEKHQDDAIIDSDAFLPQLLESNSDTSLLALIPRPSVSLQPAKPSLTLKCPSCRVPLHLPFLATHSMGNMEWLERQKSKLFSCSNCQKLLPRCSLCLFPVGVLNPLLLLKQQVLSRREKQEHFQAVNLRTNALNMIDSVSGSSASSGTASSSSAGKMGNNSSNSGSMGNFSNSHFLRQSLLSNPDPVYSQNFASRSLFSSGHGTIVSKTGTTGAGTAMAIEGNLDFGSGIFTHTRSFHSSSHSTPHAQSHAGSSNQSRTQSRLFGGFRGRSISTNSNTNQIPGSSTSVRFSNSKEGNGRIVGRGNVEKISEDSEMEGDDNKEKVDAEDDDVDGNIEDWENIKNSAISSVNFSDFWAWCQSCKHGGHTNHLADWFAVKTVCPVAECVCHCVLQDSSIAALRFTSCST